MKKTATMAALFCLCLHAVAAFTLQTPSYAGVWELDLSRSKLSPRMQVESMRMTIEQTDTELKVNISSKTSRGEQSSSLTYSLDGKETKAEMGGVPGAAATLKAKVEKDGKIKLTNARKITTQAGEITVTTKDAWEMLDGGKTLKVKRDIETPQGAISSEMYFAKK